MSKVDLAALIALCAALASATGDVIRQRSAQEITDKQVGHLELFRMSLRDKRWWLGGLAAIVNYSLQAGALAWGSVMLVTALQVTALLFALPIYARLTSHRVTRWEWIWAIVLAGALAVVIIVGDPDVRPAACAGVHVDHRRSGDGSCVGVVRAGGAGLVGPSGSGGAVGGGGRFVIGAVRGADEGTCRSARRGLGGRAAFAGVLSVATGDVGRDDFPAVGLPRRGADRLVADDDRGQAGGRRCARGSSSWRGVRRRRARGVRARRRRWYW